jgi:hypothetical protein
MWEHEKVFSLVVQLVCSWAGGEHNSQPSTEGAKAMDSRYKNDRAAAGEGWR